MGDKDCRTFEVSRIFSISFQRVPCQKNYTSNVVVMLELLYYYYYYNPQQPQPIPQPINTLNTLHMWLIFLHYYCVTQFGDLGQYLHWLQYLHVWSSF